MAITHVVLPWKCTNIENSNTLDQAHDIELIIKIIFIINVVVCHNINF